MTALYDKAMPNTAYTSACPTNHHSDPTLTMAARLNSLCVRVNKGDDTVVRATYRARMRASATQPRSHPIHPLPPALSTTSMHVHDDRHERGRRYEPGCDQTRRQNIQHQYGTHVGPAECSLPFLAPHHCDDAIRGQNAQCHAVAAPTSRGGEGWMRTRNGTQITITRGAAHNTQVNDIRTREWYGVRC